jgi:hypothetical protein
MGFPFQSTGKFTESTMVHYEVGNGAIAPPVACKRARPVGSIGVDLLDRELAVGQQSHEAECLSQ